MICGLWIGYIRVCLMPGKVWWSQFVCPMSIVHRRAVWLFWFRWPELYRLAEQRTDIVVLWLSSSLAIGNNNFCIRLSFSRAAGTHTFDGFLKWVNAERSHVTERTEMAVAVKCFGCFVVHAKTFRHRFVKTASCLECFLGQSLCENDEK